jgi:predicted TIM-barrel fold metal-dependent hydrolase
MSIPFPHPSEPPPESLPREQPAKLPVWDIHHHWVNESGYIDRLLREMDRLGIEKIGLIAMGDFVPDLFVRHGPHEGAVDNRDLAGLVKQHPDRLWGWGFIRLGRHADDEVDRLAQMGLAGLKFHAPLNPYSDPGYFPVYARAQEYRLPCLFHTGIFYPPTPMPGEGIRSENYRPIHLEAIAHEFPDLKIIGAHLGVCWNEEAAALARICPNIYFDLSGRVDGWRSSKPAEWFRQILYWPEASRKILFGSDVHADEIEDTLDDHRRIMRDLGWTLDQQGRVLSENARELFAQ